MNADLVVNSIAAALAAAVFLWFILWFPTGEGERRGRPEWLTREFWREDLGPVFRKRLRNLWIAVIAVNAIGLLQFAWLKLM